MMTAYDNDLAYIHDAGFNFFANGAGPGILSILHEQGITEGRVIDLGCGSGLWAKQLDEAGYDVLGIDISPAMVAMSKQRVPAGEFRVGSLLKVDLPECVAVTSLGECCNYLFDEDNSKKALRTLFRRVFDALVPGGVFIFDVAEPGRGAGPKQRHWQGDDWAILVETDEDTKRSLLTRNITTFRRVGKSYRRGEEVHRLQLYRGADLAAELRRLGFRVRVVRGYGAFRFASFSKAYVGLVARKPM